jgi:hypothetical protein
MRQRRCRGPVAQAGINHGLVTRAAPPCAEAAANPSWADAGAAVSLQRQTSPWVAVWTALAILLGLAGLGDDVAARAGGAEPLRALVCVRHSDDRALAARVRGQTSDLDVEILDSEDSACGAEPLSGSSSLSRRHAARAVVWMTAGELRVFVPDPEPGRLLVRPWPAR